MRASKPLSALAVIMCLFTIACGSGTPAAVAPSGSAATAAPAAPQYAPAGGTIHIPIASDWLSLEPTATNNNRSASIIYATYSQLTYMKNDGTVVGYLADSWTQTNTSITFHLRTDTGATCADGTKVTPTVVRDSFQRYIDTKSSYLGVLFGPGPYSVSADDSAGTFTFTVGTPYAPLLYAFHDMTTSIVCPAGVAQGGNLLDKTYGSGAYTIDELVKGDHVTLKLRPEFNWGPLGMTSKSPGVLDTIILQVIDNPTTGANLLLSGGLDSYDVAAGDLARVQAERGLTLWSRATGYSLNGLGFNERPGFITTDPTVRKALQTAIDPKQYETVVAAGVPTIDRGGSPFSANVECWQPMTDLLPKNPSPEAARTILTDAGWTFANGKLTKNDQPLTIRLVASPTAGSAGPEFLISSWNQMGADATFTTPTFTKYAADLYDGKFEASVTGASGFHKLPDPLALRYSGDPSPKGINYFGMNDPTLDNLAQQAESATGADVCKYWVQYQQRLVKEHNMMGFADVTANTFSRGLDDSMAYHAGIPRDFNPIMIRKLASN